MPWRWIWEKRHGSPDVYGLQLRIANSRVMGAHAVMLTATLMAFAGLMQITGVGGSKTLTAFGGAWLDRLWSWTLVLALVMVVLSRWRERVDAIDAAWLEIGAILMISTVFIIFNVIVVKSGLTTGAVVVLMAFSSTTLNMLGRGALLLRRIIWLGRANQ